MSIRDADAVVAAARQTRARSVAACRDAEAVTAHAATLQAAGPSDRGRESAPTFGRVDTGPHERDLERAMVHSRRIALAIGMVMQARGIGEGDAFTVLRAISRERGLKLAAVADDIVQARWIR